MIKGIAFDLEGTVVDVEKAHHRCHLEIAKRVGVLLNLKQAISEIPHFIGGPDEEIYREIFEKSNRTMSIVKMIELKRNQLYPDYLSQMKIKIRAGFIRFLNQARARDLAFSVGSLTPDKQASLLLKESGLLDYFLPKLIVLRNDVENVKPDPEIYLETARRMNINPSEQLVFEDSPNGIKAAIAAGSKAIGMPIYYDNPETFNKLKDAGAYKIYRSWQEVNLTDLGI